MTITYTIYVIAAAWQDLRFRSVPVWLYIVFGCAGITERLMQENIGWGKLVFALLPGICLLLLTKGSRGEIGSGDGYFFLVSALYLCLREMLVLLCFGLLFCTACCLGMLVWGCISGVSVRKKRLPFLPFLLPAWIWLLIM